MNKLPPEPLTPTHFLSVLSCVWGPALLPSTPSFSNTRVQLPVVATLPSLPDVP